MEEAKSLKSAEKGAWLSISAYIFLSAVKLTAGSIGQSEALWADGLNNLTDIIASIAVLIGLRIAQKPPDDNHRYGHSRAETIASLIAALIMFAVGFQVILQSVRSFFLPEHGNPNLMTAYIALFSAVLMFAVYAYNLRLAKKIGSKALFSAAQDNRSDGLVSIGAAIGIIGAYFGLSWLDPLAALLVGFIICHTAWEIFISASLDLSDGFEAEKLREMEKTIHATPGVKFVKDIKARLHGNRTIVDATIFVEPTLTIVEGHEIAENVEERLLHEHNVQDTNIHIEPQF